MTSIAHLIPDSNRLDLAFARSSPANGVNLMEEAYSRGFVGAFVDQDDQPQWARRCAEYTKDDFFADTPGTKKRFSDMESQLAAGDGERQITCRHALELWEANGKKGPEPYSCEQGYGSCVDASASEHMTTMFGWRAAQPQFRETFIHSAAWYWYADRGYCSDGWSGSAIAAVARRRGCAFRTTYNLGGNSIDFTDDDKNEQIVARSWCRSGIPGWMYEHTQANHAFEDGAITSFDGGVAELKKALAANGAAHCGGVRTSGGRKPFTPGRTGAHMQSAVGYDDTDEYKKWLRDTHSITLADNDYAVIMHQTWGSGWSGECGDEYWPAFWGPKPEGAWVCKGSWLLQDVEYIWLPMVKGFLGTGPLPGPQNPPITGLIYPEQAGQIIAIRGQLDVNIPANQPAGTYQYIVARDGATNKYSLIPKPIL